MTWPDVNLGNPAPGLLGRAERALDEILEETPPPKPVAHKRRRCVTCCKPPNPATECGHDHCHTDQCTALEVFWRTDYTTEGFQRP